MPRPPSRILVPYTTLFRSEVATDDAEIRAFLEAHRHLFVPLGDLQKADAALQRRIESAKLRANPLFIDIDEPDAADRKSTRLNSSHQIISYAVFCLKKKQQ